MQGIALSDLVEYLDSYLRIAEIPDYPGAVNGLQVENGGLVSSIIAAVDASQATIDGAIDASPEGATPLLLVHHGLFWDGALAVTGRRYRRLASLLAADVALYSAHLPLDVHPEVGNNVVLADRLGLEISGWFGDYKGTPIGVWGEAPSQLAATHRLAHAVKLATGADDVRVIDGANPIIRRIGLVTGGAGSMIEAARDAGIDTFVTGEGAHHTYFDAMELGVNVLYAGHYATETLGVQALASHLSERFELPWEFHDHPTGL